MVTITTTIAAAKIVAIVVRHITKVSARSITTMVALAKIVAQDFDFGRQCRARTYHHTHVKRVLYQMS